MTTIDRDGDRIYVEWPNGKREWIPDDEYRAYALGTKPIPAEYLVTTPKPVPDTKVVKGRVAVKAKSPVRPIEDDGVPRA